MCGISGIINHPHSAILVGKMTIVQHHRGPDYTGIYSNEDGLISMAHNRLSIIDLSAEANQPFISDDGNYIIVFNGEVYNYEELKNELRNEYEFKTKSDTEVILAAFIKWGKKCLDKLIGMFSFAIWDVKKHELFAARDRFGVKPFHYAIKNNCLLFASEIKAIWASELVEKVPNLNNWGTYLSSGLYDHNQETFWEGVHKLEGGHYLTWSNSKSIEITQWYNITEQVKEDARSEVDVMDELLFLLEDSIKLRFRSDVPLGICLSGGLDSSLLLALVQRVKGNDFPIHSFTFYTNDKRYDELHWVELMVKNTSVIHHACLLSANEIPQLAKNISYHMDEPYGGIPTLGMSKVFDHASKLGIKVLLDGNGMDEAWGGYEYYQKADSVNTNTGPVQGSKQAFNLNSCLTTFLKDQQTSSINKEYSTDKLKNLQIKDLLERKIPRAMRFADRNSMAYSIELREPFLDHRLVELGISQPISKKINDQTGKYLVRKLASKIIPHAVSEAPKRALQTPQREWLANDLSDWINPLLNFQASTLNKWFDKTAVNSAYKNYQKELPDNSFYIWQLINSALLLENN